jgi:hypothetical protein
MVSHQIRDGSIYQQLRRFLKLFLDLILSQQVNSELIPHSSATLYVLICLYQDTYQQLVEHLVQSQVSSLSTASLAFPQEYLEVLEGKTSCRFQRKRAVQCVGQEDGSVFLNVD